MGPSDFAHLAKKNDSEQVGVRRLVEMVASDIIVFP